MHIRFQSIIFCSLLALLGITSLVTPSQVRIKAGMLKSVFVGPVSTMPERWNAFTKFLDMNISEHVIGRESFVELNGICQALQGKRLVQDSGLVAIYKQPETGNLLIPEKKAMELTGIVASLKKLQDNLAVHGIPLLVCIVPDKASLPEATFPVGYDFYGRENLNSFIALAKSCGLEFIDMRYKINSSSQFFKTDHHLKSTTAFLVAKDIVDWLRLRNIIGSDESFDPVAENYKEWITPCKFIGSWGKRVGEVWSGDDDFIMMMPKFSSSFIVSGKALNSSDVHRKGRFEDAIIDKSVIESSDRYKNRWGANLGSKDWSQVRIHNERHGIRGKVMFIEDSFGIGTLPYVAPTVGDLIMIDLRSFRDMSATQFVVAEKPDAVVVVYNSEQLLVPRMFEF